MPTTYSSNLRLSLIGNGEQSGTWGTTTNTNLGSLLEQAITGVQVITMTNATYTLTSLNGAIDEARNAVLIVQGTNSAIQNIVAPAVEKVYVIANNTTGGFSVRIKTASSTGVLIPNGAALTVYFDGSEFQLATSPQSSTNLPNNIVIRDGSGNFAAGTITANLNGNLTAAAPTAPTAAPGTNTTQIATTAFVTNVAGALGTMSSQNANSVAITGGTINNVTTTGSSTAAVDGLGYLGMPQNLRSTGYTLALSDAGKHIYYTGSAATLVVPTNAAVALPIGATITIINNGSGSLTISTTSITMNFAGTTSTGNRTLATKGMATIIKVTTDGWFISGVGLS